MKKCLLCQSEQLVSYGDNIYGEVFCKECWEKHSCLHCKKLNLIIVFKDEDIEGYLNNENLLKFNRSHDDINFIENKPFYGHKFCLYCEECFNNGDPYKDEESVCVEIEEDDDDYDDYMEDEEDDENVNIGNKSDFIDSYYVRRGKYDLY